MALALRRLSDLQALALICRRYGRSLLRDTGLLDLSSVSLFLELDWIKRREICLSPFNIHVVPRIQESSLVSQRRNMQLSKLSKKERRTTSEEEESHIRVVQRLESTESSTKDLHREDSTGIGFGLSLRHESTVDLLVLQHY